MFRFYLNDEIKQYIREEHVDRDKISVVRDHLRETDYVCNVNINMGSSMMFLTNVKMVPDWENKCMRFKSCETSPTVKETLQKMLDLSNTFNVPFEEFINDNVSVKTVWYGHMDITERVIQMLIDAYNDDLVAYKYSFIKEAFDGHAFDNIYKINNKFYEVTYVHSGVHDDDKTHFGDKLCLTESTTGQYHYVTALELLRGKYDYNEGLKKTEEGLLIPDLSIKKYKIIPPLEYDKKNN